MTGTVEWSVIAGRLALSILFGGIIGIEREFHGRSAGLRTHMLVSLGSALFTVLSFSFPEFLGSDHNIDPTRIAAQILTGVGFLGAGTIIQGRGSVAGLTTAASIWLVAAIGMAVGVGCFLGGFIGTILGVVVLMGVYYVEVAMIRRKGIRRLVKANLRGEADAEWLGDLVRAIGIQEYGWGVSPSDEGIKIRVDGVFRKGDLEKFLGALHERGEVRSLQVARR